MARKRKNFSWGVLIGEAWIVGPISTRAKAREEAKRIRYNEQHKYYGIVIQGRAVRVAKITVTS